MPYVAVTTIDKLKISLSDNDDDKNNRSIIIDR